MLAKTGREGVLYKTFPSKYQETKATTQRSNLRKVSSIVNNPRVKVWKASV